MMILWHVSLLCVSARALNEDASRAGKISRGMTKSARGANSCSDSMDLDEACR
jgi:hypothetical protein